MSYVLLFTSIAMPGVIEGMFSNLISMEWTIAVHVHRQGVSILFSSHVQ